MNLRPRNITNNPQSNSAVCLVIPTYNEVENIGPLLQQLMHLDSEWQVLIVDDTSPDGTAERVAEFAKTNPRVQLSLGEKNGLGSAYKRGIKIALEQLNAQIVVQMDADFSHDPSQVPDLLRLVREGADVAIGSRYIQHASIDVRWGRLRRWLSGGGNWLAQHIAGIRKVRDCTSGFKAIAREILVQADIANLPVSGYVFQIALLHRLLLHDARVVEHPIHFGEREHGSTKMGWYDMVEFFISVWILRFPNIRTFAKFCLTGLSGVVVNLAIFQAMLALDFWVYIASPIAIEVSILWNFMLNNYWTFADRQLMGNKLVRGLKFNIASLGTLAISFATFFALSVLFPDWIPLAHQAGAIIPAVLFNYFINSYWTFRERRA